LHSNILKNRIAFMKAKIAIATVSGKAYYLIVSELKRKNIPFLSLTPYESVPVEVEVVITTAREKSFVKHGRLLIYQEGMNVEALVNETLKAVRGKEFFEKIVIGVDPGEVYGLAVLADGKVIETGNCFGFEETLCKIENLLKNIENTPTGLISVKIGDGVQEYKENLLQALDKALPPNIVLESVSEAGTNRNLNEAKHRRGLRDIVSAIQIAGRSGYRFQRRKASE